jgi:N,N-dimethylformamidase beta subunit-like protein
MRETVGWSASRPSRLWAGRQADQPFLRSISPAALVFAALVAATVGAFFVTTRLKRSAPVIEQLTFNRHFSPNGDGRIDFAQFAFRLRRTDDATVSIVNRDGGEIRTLAQNRRLEEGRRHRFRWDGRTTLGAVAPDGEYHLRVGLRRQGRSVTSPLKLFLDTRPPRPVVRHVSPGVITPTAAAPGRRRATLRFVGPRRSPTLLVYRTDLRRPRLVARRKGRSNSSSLSWDGFSGLGRRHRPAAAGSYLLAVRVRDAAGNLGPARLPPTRATVRGHPGLEVRYLAARAPTGPVRAGARSRFLVFAGGARYHWRVRRLGSGRAVSKGATRVGALRVRAPRGRSGIALLELRLGTRRYSAPFAVQSRRRRSVLVVLPALAWQATNPVEQNGDGFPDVLPLDRQVDPRRPFAGNGLPPGFLSRTAPVLSFLDGTGSRYDLTTDLALARSSASLGRYGGILFADADRFATPALVASLRAYVRSGGRLAWTGLGAFSRPVNVTAKSISVRSAAAAGGLSGERVQVQRGERPLAVLGDRIGFFAGVGTSFGPFPGLEAQLEPAPGARMLASAGAEPRRPSIAVYRLGRGVVARVGVGGWGASLRSSPDAGRIMRRLWTLLSR